MLRFGDEHGISFPHHGVRPLAVPRYESQIGLELSMPDSTSEPAAGLLWVDIDSPQDVVATGLRHILESKFGASLYVTVGPVAGEPDVILYDVIGLADGDTAELDRLRQGTGSVVIAVSYDGLRPDLEDLALKAGAAAVIPLKITAEELAEVICDAIEGNLEQNESVRTVDDSTYPGQEHISRRESQVLALIVQGLSNQQIAHECFLSVNSVKTYIRSAYRKIGVTHRAQAVAWGMQHGFVPAPPDA